MNRNNLFLLVLAALAAMASAPPLPPSGLHLSQLWSGAPAPDLSQPPPDWQQLSR